MPSQLEIAVKNFRNEILQTESKATLTTVKEYAKVRAELVTQINELTSAIASSGREFTAGEIVRYERAQQLLTQVETRMTELSRGTLTIIETGQDAAVVLGQEHTQGMAIVGAMGDSRATAQVVNSWNHLNTGAVESMVGRLSDGSPLNRYLATVAPDTSDRISTALVRAIALGENPRQTAARLEKEVDISGAKLLMTTRDSVMNSYRDASLMSMAENADILRGWTWVCALDNSCAACVALHGREFPITEQFFANHNSCFVAGTMVNGPRAIAGTERWYSGSVVEIETEHDRRIAVTPNHPILTTEGWVAAGLLNEGTNLVCGSFGERRVVGVDGDYDDVPARIEEVAHTLRRDGGVFPVSMPTSPMDFHGDGLGSDICVVRTDRQLGDTHYATLAKHGGEFHFVRRYVNHALLPCLRCLTAFLERSDATARRIMGSLSESLAILWGCLGHPEIHALATVSGFDAMLQESCANARASESIRFRERLFGFAREVPPAQFLVRDPTLSMLRRDRFSAGELRSLRTRTVETAFSQDSFQSNGPKEWDRLTDALHAFPGDITTDRVLKVSVRAFDGHVYNLETTESWYFANGIIAHNCRCTPAPLVSGVDNPIAKDAGEQYFGGLKPEQQDRVLGLAAGQAYRQGDVKLDDFVTLRKDATWGDSYVQGSFASAKASADARSAE